MEHLRVSGCVFVSAKDLTPAEVQIALRVFLRSSKVISVAIRRSGEELERGVD
jgi:hypothetical protein